MPRKEGDKFHFDSVELPRTAAPAVADPEPEDAAPERDDQVSSSDLI